MIEACTRGVDTGFVALGHAKVAMLGVVQGITELLPISSTAHMRVVPALLGWPDPGSAFSAAMQLAALAAVLSQFLRRMALRDAPAAAALPDVRWLHYLDSRLPGDEFARGVGRALLDAPFRPAQVYDAAALIALVRRWTRNALDTEVRRA